MNLKRGGEKYNQAIKNEIDYNKIKIIHTMADGTVRDSIEGYEIPYNETTAIAYDILAKWIIDKQESQNTRQ